MLRLMKTCCTLKVLFLRTLGDRLYVPGHIAILPLSDPVRQAATAA